MIMRRRRPLMRAAVVGGGAYVAGKRVAGRQAEQAQAEDELNQRISDLEQQQAPPEQYQPAPPPPPAPPAAAGPSLLDQLNQLSALHEQGALTDNEFTAAKAKLLG
jgi:hypothetical protein